MGGTALVQASLVLARVAVNDEPLAHLGINITPPAEVPAGPVLTPTLADMPDFWDPRMRPCVLKDDHIYKGKGGVWYHPDGRIANRKERRAAGVK